MADETTTDETTADGAATDGAEVDEVNEAQLAALREALGDGLLDSHIAHATLWVRVSRDSWVAAAEAARDRLGCAFFDFLSGIDWMPSPWGRYEDAVVDNPPARPEAASGPFEVGYAGGEARFQVFMRVADVRRHRAVIVKADVPEGDFSVPTITPVYAGANWHERECWEMYGITFTGHPALRHLYLPGGFEGHPLRKDFPLVARLVKPWPGLVDVEPMPDVPEPAEADPAAADPAAPDGGANGDGGTAPEPEGGQT